MSQQITPSPALDKILRAHAAAATLGVSKSTIWRYVRQGKLSAVRLSARVTGFRSSEIQAMIAEGA